MTETIPQLQRSELPVICSDYDASCRGMTLAQAIWCYEGCQNHPCVPESPEGFGKADGLCPILARELN